MTIRRGEEWGRVVDRPPGLVVVASDVELAARVAADPTAELAVRAGDVHRALGSPAERREVHRLPMDLVRVTVDGRAHIAVAHVVVRRSWWRGPILAVMNVDQLGGWNVAPRAHPNDGKLDVVEVAASMSVRQRIAARRRLALGTHLPHPDISVTNTTSRDWEWERPMRIWIDGRRLGEGRRVTVEVEPDAYALYV